MIDIPMNPICPCCKTEGIDNLNMLINVLTEQPLKYFKNLPGRLSLRPKTSSHSACVDWDSEKAMIICQNCGYARRNVDFFEKII